MRLSAWVALRCREPRFQAFVQATDEAAAATAVRTMCNITSRGELDRDAEAAARFHSLIRIPYSEFNHAQEATQ